MAQRVWIGKHRGKTTIQWKKLSADGKRNNVQRLVVPAHEAQAAKHKKLEELNAAFEDTITKQVRRLLSEHLQEYAEFLLATGVQPIVAHMVKQRASRVLDTAGIRYFADLSASKIQATVAKLRAVPRRKGAKPSEQPLLGPRSRNFHRAAVRQFVRWLVEDRRAPHYPLAGLKLERPDVDLRHARLPITSEQFEQLYLATSASTRVIEGMGGVDRSRLYALAFQTGLRRGELASLIPRSFVLDGSPPTVVIEAASAKARRRDVVPIPPGLVQMLKPWLATLEASETLFPRLKTKDTAKMVRLDLQTIGVAYEENGKFRDFHSLRHGFVSALWKSGASAAVIRELSRHRDLRTTQGYSHADLSDKAEAVRRLPELPPLPSRPTAGEEPAEE